jgi:hypothetical protein
VIDAGLTAQHPSGWFVSRLQNEASSRPDVVVHPGVPLTVRAHFQYFL